MTVSLSSSRMSRGRIILIGILGISLLGNAVALGAAWRFQQVRVELMGTDTEALPAFPSDLRRALRHKFQDNQDLLSPKISAVVDARRMVVETSTSAHFDKEAIEAAMADFRQALDEAARFSQSLILEVIEERASRSEPD